MFTRNILVFENLISIIGFCIGFFDQGRPEFGFSIVETSSANCHTIKFRQILIDGIVSPDSVDIEPDIIESIAVNFLIFD